MFVPVTNMYMPVYFSCMPTSILASDRQESVRKRAKIRRQKDLRIDDDVSTQFPIFVLTIWL